MTVFAVAFWTFAAGLVGYALGPALGIIAAVAVAAGFICQFLNGREK